MTHQSGAASCKTRCSGGHGCVCAQKYRHEVHMCNDSRCVCSSEAREASVAKIVLRPVPVVVVPSKLNVRDAVRLVRTRERWASKWRRVR